MLRPEGAGARCLIGFCTVGREMLEVTWGGHVPATGVILDICPEMGAETFGAVAHRDWPSQEVRPRLSQVQVGCLETRLDSLKSRKKAKEESLSRGGSDPVYILQIPPQPSNLGSPRTRAIHTKGTPLPRNRLVPCRSSRCTLKRKVERGAVSSPCVGVILVRIDRVGSALSDDTEYLFPCWGDGLVSGSLNFACDVSYTARNTGTVIEQKNNRDFHNNFPTSPGVI